MSISIKDLRYFYPKKSPLFNGLNWYVPEGSVVGLLGKNGAGKSTLLHLLVGLLFPKDGTLLLGKHIPKKRTPEFLEEIFLLSEDIFYAGNMSISTYAHVMGRFYPRFDFHQFDQILNDFDLSKEVKLKSLSLGERRKVFLSFGLSTNCKYMLFDEPTNGLDIPSKRIFRKVVLSNLKEDQTLLISTHLVGDVENLIDRVAIIKDGKIQLDADLLDLSDQYVFSYGTEAPELSLHVEKYATGYQYIMPRKAHENHTPVNLEMLFNAVLLNKLKFSPDFSNQKPEIL